MLVGSVVVLSSDYKSGSPVQVPNGFQYATYNARSLLSVHPSLSSHSVSTRSSDSLVLSIPYVRSSLGIRAFSVIGPRLWNSLPPDTRNSSTNVLFQAQNTPFQNCVPSLGSFLSPLTVYPNFDSGYSHFMLYRMTPSVRHRAIEVHYYYYYSFLQGIMSSVFEQLNIMVVTAWDMWLMVAV